MAMKVDLQKFGPIRYGKWILTTIEKQKQKVMLYSAGKPEAKKIYSQHIYVRYLSKT